VWAGVRRAHDGGNGLERPAGANEELDGRGQRVARFVAGVELERHPPQLVELRELEGDPRLLGSLVNVAFVRFPECVDVVVQQAFGSRQACQPECEPGAITPPSDSVVGRSAGPARQS
jgi:hypothetical protein